jgi:serpin B
MNRKGMIGIAATLAIAASAAQLPAAEASDVAQLVQANSAFALDLYGKLRQQPGNVFFSPYSISVAMAMTYGGAGGDTAAQMAKAMHFALGQGQLHPAFAALQAGLKTEAGKADFQLSIANRLWAEKSFTFLATYLKLTNHYYGAPAEGLDFIGAPEPSRKTINRWVEHETHNKINELLPPKIIDSDTRLVLTNAIYFLGTWASQFLKKATSEAPFYLAADRQVTVPMMSQTGRFRLGAAPGMQLLDLPYKGGRLSMVVLLPDSRDGLPKLEGDLRADKLAGWLSSMRDGSVSVFLPRFKLTSQFDLKKTFQALGMALPFTMQADFSGMDGRKDLYVSALVHQAAVDVDEQGTEAAAATAVVVTLKSVFAPPAQFRADHPFLFLIRDNKTGAILFLGRMANPKG